MQANLSINIPTLSIPYIAEQLQALDENLVREEIEQWSEWDVSDPDQNLNRLLWIACGDIVERQFMEEAA